VAVWIDEAVCVHEAEILRLVVRRTTGSERFGNQAIDLFAAFATEGKQNLDGLAGVADFFRRENPKLGVRRQHEADRVADDEAGAVIAGHFRIRREAECREEDDGPREVGDWKVDEQLSAHGFPLAWLVRSEDGCRCLLEHYRGRPGNVPDTFALLLLDRSNSNGCK
jgi:hypothetical protein